MDEIECHVPASDVASIANQHLEWAFAELALI